MVKILEIQGLTKHYRSKTALDDISIDLNHGIYALLGPNGAGKTTLINIVAGLLAQSSGSVRWKSSNIDLLGAAYREILGFLPQSVELYNHFTARQYLRYMCSLKGLYPRAIDRKAREKCISDLLETMNLIPDADRRAGVFSGGMKQRLGIAQALLGNPELIILDEPTSGLDPQERIRFRNTISTLAGDRLVIWATHIVSDIATIANQVIMLKAGKCIAIGTPNKLITSMEGKVWALTVRTENIGSYCDQFMIGSIITDGETRKLRVISNENPHPDAICVEPDLEDLYVYRYEETSQ